MVRILSAVLAGSVILAGCARPGAETRTYVGQVTEVDALTVCVGAPEAKGECFIKDQVTERLSMKDCVSVTYTPEPGNVASSRANKVVATDRASHQVECPEP
jgi:nitrous oxide reductase accessory protein NosL